MVKGIKNGTLTKEDYTQQYYNLLLDRWRTASSEILSLVKMVKGTESMPPRDLTVVCFCPAGSFCHRYLLINFLQDNWQVPYGGERK